MIDPIYLIGIIVSLAILIVGFFLKESYLVMIGGILIMTIGTFIMLYGLPYVSPSDASACAATCEISEDDPIWSNWVSTQELCVDGTKCGFFSTCDQMAGCFGDYVPYTGAAANVNLGNKNITTTGYITALTNGYSGNISTGHCWMNFIGGQLNNTNCTAA